MLLPNEYVVSLATLNKGAAIELFEKELNRVLENIADSNVEPLAKRKIALTVTFQPSRDVKSAAVSIKCESKLAAVKPAGTTVYFGKVEGELKAVENDPDQGALFDNSETKKGLELK